MLITIPRILIAGAQSGAGKTSVALGLAAALKRRGLTVQTFKTGPDFLDPTYLAQASGRTCYNLDIWMTGEAYMRGLFASAAADADVAVIEGAMGLFDGADIASLEGSAAQVAQSLGAPVLLVCGGGGVARSFAAMVKGYSEFEDGVTVAGVVANHCGSQDHVRLLADALQAAGGPKLVGGIVKDALPRFSSRHLGLETADGRNLSPGMIDAFAGAIEKSLSIDRILNLARDAASVPANGVWPDDAQTQERVRLGVAKDEAFHFYYPDNLRAFEACGCEIVEFSPLAGRGLPENLDGLYFGGGYPELSAGALAENRAMLEAVRAFAASGRPVYAECGGLMYLSQGVETLEGERYGMTGLLPSWTRMRKRFASLGYVEVALTGDSLFGPKQTALRGHRFHYSELMDDPSADPEWRTVYSLKRKRTGETIREGYQRGRTLASYAHLHFASRPASLRRFAANCAQARRLQA